MYRAPAFFSRVAQLAVAEESSCRLAAASSISKLRWLTAGSWTSLPLGSTLAQPTNMIQSPSLTNSTGQQSSTTIPANTALQEAYRCPSPRMQFNAWYSRRGVFEQQLACYSVQERSFTKRAHQHQKSQSRRKGAMSVRGRPSDAAVSQKAEQPIGSVSEALVEPAASQQKLSEQRDNLPVVQPTETPASDVQIANILQHPALIVTRNVEWGTVILGFEQANKYTVLDQDGNVVALLAEDLGSFGKEIGRQFLRTRRNFTATIFSPEGQVILKLRRPMYLVNSTIYVENGGGEVIGEVKQRFHLWQRNYDIYLDKRQVATINSPLLAWEFALRDANGGVMALIDRNFQGFGKELFTDAGKYVIHFGDSPTAAAEQVANTVQAAHPDKPRPEVTTLAKFRTDVAVIPTSTGNQLEVVRPLTLDERTLALAAAISIDYDYFSQHSHGSGFLPHMLIPYPGVPPVPFPGGGEGGDGETPPAEGAPTDSSTGGGTDGGRGLDSGEGAFSQGGENPSNLDQDLGSDTFDTPDFGQDSGEAGSWGDDSAGWSSGAGDGDSAGSAWDLVRGMFGGDD